MQVAFLVKPLAAIRVWTNKGFLSGVNTHVGLEVEVKGEALGTKIALVRFLACMHQHVPLQLCVVQEPFAASIISALK